MNDPFEFITDGAVLETRRVPSGLTSLDLALSNDREFGVPLGQIVEIFGEPGLGKSSLTYFLAAKMSTRSGIENPRIVLCDVEGLNIHYLRKNFERLGFKGQVRLIPSYDNKGNLLTHSDMLDITTEEYRERDNVSAVIIDAVGSIASDAELNSPLKDANMGTRARLMSKFIEKILAARPLRLNANVYLVNHEYQVLGGFGSDTSGGKKIKYGASVRIRLKKGDVWKKSGQDTPIAIVTQGQVVKLRDGGHGDKFQFVLVPNYGISENLTAVVDCLELCSDVVSITKNGILTVDGESFGYLSKLVELEIKGREDEKAEKFEVFYRLLGNVIQKTFGGAS